MKMMVVATMVWVGALLSNVAAQPTKSVNDGVYTAAQADRGTAVFSKVCASCHETSRFTGDEFLPVWVGKSLFELYDVIHTTMPEDNPGSLKPQQYVDVLAYFLKLNGYPVGTDELPSTDAALKTIKFDKKSR
jgi:mono/diheme cytochrome c family protein